MKRPINGLLAKFLENVNLEEEDDIVFDRWVERFAWVVFAVHVCVVWWYLLDR